MLCGSRGVPFDGRRKVARIKGTKPPPIKQDPLIFRGLFLSPDIHTVSLDATNLPQQLEVTYQNKESHTTNRDSVPLSQTGQVPRPTGKSGGLLPISATEALELVCRGSPRRFSGKAPTIPPA